MVRLVVVVSVFLKFVTTYLRNDFDLSTTLLRRSFFNHHMSMKTHICPKNLGQVIDQLIRYQKSDP